MTQTHIKAVMHGNIHQHTLTEAGMELKTCDFNVQNKSSCTTLLSSCAHADDNNNYCQNEMGFLQLITSLCASWPSVSSLTQLSSRDHISGVIKAEMLRSRK